MWISDLLRRIHHLLRRDRFTADLDEEMRLHVELRARKLAADGVRNAGSAAARQFGNRGAIHDITRDMWGWSVWERLWHDVRHAARRLRKTPGFTFVVVATLAIGRGINTGVFSVLNAVLLRPLPYPDASRIVSLWEETTRAERTGFSSTGTPVTGSGAPTRTTVSVANLADYRRISAFSEVAAFDAVSMNLTGNGTPVRLTGETVTPEYLAVLGVAPAIGRNFETADDQVVILNHGFWQARLGADPDVLQRTVMLDGKPYRVTGVMPESFRPPVEFTTPGTVEFWIPARYTPDLLTNRSDHEVNAISRLRDGVSLEAARAQLESLNTSLATAYPASNGFIRARMEPLQTDLMRNVGDSLTALFGASALIVLIACGNVANLLLVRAIGRRHEIGVRVAIGANRWRVARQFLVESLVIAAAGCATGLSLGYGIQRALLAIAPANLPMIQNVHWDWRVFACACVVAAFTGTLFGLLPAWHSSQANPADSLRGNTRIAGGGAQARWRAILTAVEIALSLILLVGAGLLLRSFVTLMGVDLGFQPDRVLAMNIGLPAARYPTPQDRLRFFEQLAERVRALPGVQAVGYANRLPLRGGWSSGIAIDRTPDVTVAADCQAVGTGYFDTLGIPLLRGRSLSLQDRDGAPPVAIVNQAFSKKILNGADPVGRHFRRGNAPWVEIIGVVNDIRRAGKAADMKPQVYFPASQTHLYPVPLADFAVRTAGDPRQMVNTIQAEVWNTDRDQPVTSVRTLDEIVTASVAQRRFQTTLLLVFAAVAVGLALIGIYAVLSYSVAQRTSELGIRVALGARPGSILALVLRQAGAVIAIGLAAGLAGAWAVTVYLESMLFQVKAHDWRAYTAAVALLAAVSLLASLIPARRGSRVDPVVALRSE